MGQLIGPSIYGAGAEVNTANFKKFFAGDFAIKDIMRFYSVFSHSVIAMAAVLAQLTGIVLVLSDNSSIA